MSNVKSGFSATIGVMLALLVVFVGIPTLLCTGMCGSAALVSGAGSVARKQVQERQAEDQGVKVDSDTETTIDNINVEAFRDAVPESAKGTKLDKDIQQRLKELDGDKK